MSSYSEPTADQAVDLFQAIEKKFPHASLGEDKWYLVAVSALGDPSADLLIPEAIRTCECRANTCRNAVYLPYQQTSIYEL